MERRYPDEVYRMLALGNPHLYRRVWYVNYGETLTGFVEGQSASDIEERFAVAHQRMRIPFDFRYRINPLTSELSPQHMNIAGELEIDILSTYNGIMYPLLIQGDISHFYAAWMRERDNAKVAAINDFLRAFNAHPTVLIPFWLLKDQDTADRVIRYGYATGWSQEFYQ